MMALRLPDVTRITPSVAAKRFQLETGVPVSSDTIIRRIKAGKLNAIRTSSGRFLLSTTNLTNRIREAL